MINNRPFTCTVWLLPVLSSYKWLYVEALVYTRVNIRKGESEHCQIGCHWRDTECIISDSRVSDRQPLREKETAREVGEGDYITYREDELRRRRRSIGKQKDQCSISPNNDYLWIYLPLDGPLENNSNIANYVEFRTARCRNYDNPNRVDNRASPLGPFR